MIKFIIYDLDGTLIDSVNTFMEAYSYSIEHGAGLNLEWSDIQKHLGPNEVGVLKNIAPLDYKYCLDLFYKYEKDHINDINLFPGIFKLLERMDKKGIKQSIITGRAITHAEYFVNYFNMNYFFSDILVGGITKDIKVSNIELLVEKYGYEKSEIVHIGDTLNDVVAANKAKITSCICLWGKTDAQCNEILDNSLCKNVFHTVSEFESWLLKGNINE